MKTNSRFNKRLTKERLIESQDVLEGINGILRDDLAASYIAMQDLENYDTSKWEYKMADHLATQRTLRKIINILTIK